MIIFRGDGTSIEEITNGKYQINDYPDDTESGSSVKYSYALVNNKTNQVIGKNGDWVKKYKVDINKHIIYMTTYIISDNPLESGVIKYHVLNYDTDDYNSYSNLEDMDELERKIFEDENDWLIPNRNS